MKCFALLRCINLTGLRGTSTTPLPLIAKNNKREISRTMRRHSSGPFAALQNSCLLILQHLFPHSLELISILVSVHRTHHSAVPVLSAPGKKKSRLTKCFSREPVAMETPPPCPADVWVAHCKSVGGGGERGRQFDAEFRVTIKWPRLIYEHYILYKYKYFIAKLQFYQPIKAQVKYCLSQLVEFVHVRCFKHPLLHLQ